MNEPLDEVLFQHLKRWKYVQFFSKAENIYLLGLLFRKISFQDVAKSGLKFGDEGE